MKKVSEMIGTKRMAIKLDDDSKILIDSKRIGTKERYILSVSNDVILKGIDVNAYLLVLENMRINEEGVIFKFLILENVGLKTVYVNDKGYVKEQIKSYIINPEEDSKKSKVIFNAGKIKEITYDPEMIPEMLKSSIIQGENAVLSSIGLAKPELTIIYGGKNKEKVLAKNRNT